MKHWRVLVLLLLLALGGAAVWMSFGQSDPTQAAPGEDVAQVAYDYEAHDVVLRQMGPDGRMAFQIDAKEVTQLPDSGRISARGLTLYHDPPGTEPGSAKRWTLTADSGELPAEGGVVTLTGKVRAHGLLGDNPTEMTVATERLRYDMTTQVLSIDDNDVFRLAYGGTRVQGRGLTANVRTTDVKIKSQIQGTHEP